MSAVSDASQWIVLLFFFVVLPLVFVSWILWITAGPEFVDELRAARREARRTKPEA